MSTAEDDLLERPNRRAPANSPARERTAARKPSRFGQALERTLALAALLVIGLMAGVFFAFSVLVMPGLENSDGLIPLPSGLPIPGLSDANGLVALPTIQSIAAVDSPLFGLVSYGAAVIALIAVIVGLLRRDGVGSILMIVAGAFYLVGVFLVTLVFNNRFDDDLAGFDVLDTSSVGLAREYLRDWSRWNAVRAVAAFVAFVLFAVAGITPRRSVPSTGDHSARETESSRLNM